MKHKVSTLSGALLDAAVAKAEGKEVLPFTRADGSEGNTCWSQDSGCYVGWNPSTDWRDGGPIIERERIATFFGYYPALWPVKGECWIAGFDLDAAEPNEIAVLVLKHVQGGPTPLSAAMRAYIASKFGEEVELP